VGAQAGQGAVLTVCAARRRGAFDQATRCGIIRAANRC
jgi:hypothetical protein